MLADYLAVQFIDRVFDNPQLYSGFETMSALFGYSMQVYADFSGYTDVAIGIAMLLGFTLPKNFNSPYKASSVAEFWRRWHLSLSTWLRDYLYIPLGGNRTGSIASYLIVFLFLVMIALVVDQPLLELEENFAVGRPVTLVQQGHRFSDYFGIYHLYPCLVPCANLGWRYPNPC